MAYVDVKLKFGALPAARPATADLFTSMRLFDPGPSRSLIKSAVKSIGIGAHAHLLRAPHDKSTLPVYFDAKKVAVLGPATYTVTVVAPGSYQIASSPMGRSESMPASSLTVKAGERRFLYVSAPTSRSMSTSFMFLPNVGVVPLVVPTYGPAGAKTWKECSELDAQGFISISRPILPEPGAA